LTRHRIVNAPELGAPSGFSHAVVTEGSTVYLAGQIGSGKTFVEQFDNAIRNLLTALRAAGGEPEHIVSMQIFVTDVPAYKASLRELAGAWKRHFGTHYPAAGLFGVTRLFDDPALIELMAVAVIPAEQG
jgi:enamine deaminase RidA (YjgF/YER057c/UK114 family)